MKISMQSMLFACIFVVVLAVVLAIYFAYKTNKRLNRIEHAINLASSVASQAPLGGATERFEHLNIPSEAFAFDYAFKTSNPSYDDSYGFA